MELCTSTIVIRLSVGMGMQAPQVFRDVCWCVLHFFPFVLGLA